jgi:hypothetical protein
MHDPEDPLLLTLPKALDTPYAMGTKRLCILRKHNANPLHFHIVGKGYLYGCAGVLEYDYGVRSISGARIVAAPLKNDANPWWGAFDFGEASSSQECVNASEEASDYGASKKDESNTREEERIPSDRDTVPNPLPNDTQGESLSNGQSEAQPSKRKAGKEKISVSHKRRRSQRNKG